MGWISHLREFDGEIVQRAMDEEYLGYTQLWPFYPDFGSPGSVICFFLTASIVFVNAVFLTITALVSVDDLAVLSESLHFLSLVVIALTAQLQLFTSRREIAKIHWYIGIRFVVYNDLEEETKRIERETRKYKKVWLVFWPVYITGCALFLVLLAPFLDYWSGDGGHQSDSSRVNTRLPISYWTPYDSTGILAYYGTAVFQLVMALAVAGVISTADVLYIFLCQNIICQLAILKRCLALLPRRAARSAGVRRPDFSDPRFLGSYESCLEQNLRHHQIIIECFNHLSALGGNIVLVAFVTGGAMIAASAVLSLSSGLRIGPLATTILFTTGEIFNMFILCWFGEQINHLSNEIRREIYFSPWYLCTERIKRSIRIIQAGTVRPLVFLAGGIIPARMETFAHILNASYSYFNLLYAFK